MLNVTIDTVRRIVISAVEESEPDEEDEEVAFYRTLTIESESGEIIEIDLYAESPEGLEIEEEE